MRPRSKASGLIRTSVLDLLGSALTAREGYRCARRGRAGAWPAWAAPRRAPRGSAERPPGERPRRRLALAGGALKPGASAAGRAERGWAARLLLGGRTRRASGARRALRPAGALRGRSRSRARGAAGSARARLRSGASLRRLAVGADRPARVDRLLARLARVLHPGPAVRTAQVGALDRVAAVGAGLLLELPDAELRGADLELALSSVLEELGRAQDRVDDRARRTGTARRRWRRPPAPGPGCGAGRPGRSRRPARSRRPRANSTTRFTNRLRPSSVMPNSATSMARGA